MKKNKGAQHIQAYLEEKENPLLCKHNCLSLKLNAANAFLSLITFICTQHVHLFLPGGTAASRINRQLTIVQPQPIRHHLQRERSCIVTVASQWTARVCRSSKRRRRRRRRIRRRSVRSQATDTDRIIVISAAQSK